jgi:DNA-directed RNA polymerase specialized sigma subunit
MATAKNNKKKATTKKKKNYLNNKDLLAEVIKSKEQDQMTDKLAKMLQMLCARYATRAQFANYTYNEDMQAYAMMMLVRTWRSFDPNKSKNPFAFFTQCIKNSFIQMLNKEKQQRNVRDELLVDQGLNPSYTYQLEHENQSDSYDAQDPVEVGVSARPVGTSNDDDDLISY